MTMRDLGVGRTSLEENILIEAQAACAELTKDVTSPCDIRPLVQMAVTNIICAIIFSERYIFSLKDPWYENDVNI